MKLIFLGPPGIGKGTVADRIKDKYNLAKISTGDLLRENIANKTKLGIDAQGYMNQGKLVPDSLVIKIIQKKLKDIKNYILDGFPRTIVQAQELEKFAKIDKVVNFTAKDKTIIDRLSGRRICPKCNAIYHIRNIPPKKSGICDKDGTKLIQREDDKPEKIKERLIAYQKQTKPLIAFYNKKNILINIDTDKPLQEIIKNTIKIIGLKR